MNGVYTSLGESLGGLCPVFRGVRPESVPVDMAGDWEAAGPGYAIVTLREPVMSLERFRSTGAKCIVADHSASLHEAIPAVFVNMSSVVYAQIFSAWYGHPEKALETSAITGTNGKTSAVHFLQHILECSGLETGLFSTVQLFDGQDRETSRLTTQYPPALYRHLASCVSKGCQHCVIEVSSHGIVEDRVHGIELSVGGVTSVSSDHLDFHGSLVEYHRAKMRLCEYIRPGAVFAVANANNAIVDGLLKKASTCDLRPVRVGFSNQCDLRMSVLEENLVSGISKVSVEWNGNEMCSMDVPLVGRHNLSNLGVSVSMACGLGIEERKILLSLRDIRLPEGRFQSVRAGSGPLVIVDYGHTADALRCTLTSIKRMTNGLLTIVFGCGGDRDRGKRNVMGAVASSVADNVVITSDNPRNEDPGDIANEIMCGVNEEHASKCITIVDRKAAIRYAIRNSCVSDVVLISGKGHETTIVGNGGKIDHNDVDVAMCYLRQYW